MERKIEFAIFLDGECPFYRRTLGRFAASERSKRHGKADGARLGGRGSAHELIRIWV